MCLFNVLVIRVMNTKLLFSQWMLTNGILTNPTRSCQKIDQSPCTQYFLIGLCELL